jgi:hypothetical protein
MKKSQIVFVALVAMFAFGALTVESASAATFLLALWLAKGVAVTEPLAVEAEGELTLEDVAGPAILCSGMLDGWVGSESLGEISEVLELVTHSLISKTQLVEPGLVCTNVKLCEEPLVWLDNLPWQTEVELVEDAGTFFAVLILPHPGGENPGWHIACMKNIIGTEDLCSFSERVAQLTLEGATLLASFSEAFRELTGAGTVNCTLGGAGTGLVISDTPFGALRLVNGEELTASSETSEA